MTLAAQNSLSVQRESERERERARERAGESERERERESWRESRSLIFAAVNEKVSGS